MSERAGTGGRGATPGGAPESVPPPGMEGESAAVPVVDDLRSVDNRRVAARFLDFLICAALYVVALVFARPLDFWEWIALLWVEVTYFFVCEAVWGQTIGKWQNGIRVTLRDGGRPSLNAIAARNVIRIVEEPVIALLVLVGSRSRRQRVGDLVAGTIVTRNVRGVPPATDRRVLAYPAVWALGAVVLVLSVGPTAGRDEVLSGDSRAGGYYPPAPSLAVGMTSEWRAFADQVDRICAYNFNRAMAGQAQIAAQLEGQPGRKIEAAIHYNWAAAQMATFRMVGDLGEPPAEAALLESWRRNVRHRGELFQKAGDAWFRRDRWVAGDIHARIDQLKIKANELGQRFGLRICTSNGPGRPPVDA